VPPHGRAMTTAAARPPAEAREPTARPSGEAVDVGLEAAAAAVGVVVAAVRAPGAAVAGASEWEGAEVSRASDEQHLTAAVTEEVTAAASLTPPSQPWTAHKWRPVPQGRPHAWAPATTRSE